MIFLLVQMTLVLVGALLLATNKSDSQKLAELDRQLFNRKSILLLLVVIILVGSFLRFYKLDVQDFYEDEYQVIAAAKGFLETGEFVRWDWIKDQPNCNEMGECIYYDRAWPHTFLIAQVYRFMGVSEFSSRLTSVIFGVLLLIIAYPVINYFTQSKLAAILTTSLFAIYPFFITISRYTRMYALLVPLYLLLTYFVYRFLTENNQVNFLNTKLNKFIKEHFNFNFKLLPVVILLLVINYLIHINSLVILPISLIFLTYLSLTKKDVKYQVMLVSVLVLTVIGVAVVAVGILPGIGFISSFGVRNYDYFGILFRYPLPTITSSMLFLIPLIRISKIRLQPDKDKLIFLYLSVVFSIFFFVFIANRYVSGVYISHVMPIALSLLALGFVSVLVSIKNRPLIISAAILLITASVMDLANTRNTIYSNENKYGHFSVAYQTIIDNFDPENDVIFGQYLRSYYLSDLPPNTKIIDMKSSQEYSLAEFKNDLNMHESGWIVYATRKNYHLRSDVIEFIDKNFNKYHGYDIDNLNVEVYSFK